MNNEEEVIQAECIAQASRHYPQIAPTITANYNNVGAGVERGRASRMVGVEISKGLKGGEPDLTIYYRKRAFCVEIKTTTGHLSKNQKSYIPFLQKQDIPVFLCRSAGEFLKVLSIIEGIRNECYLDLITKKTDFLLNYNLKLV